MSAGDTRLVWDLPVRITHWLLALCVPLAWITHELGTEYFRWHCYVGYTVVVLVAFRLLWGVVGTRHARLSAFVRGPGTVFGYLRGVLRGKAASSVGHNAAGGWMVIVLLGLLALQGVTGLFANDQIFNVGPFYGWVSPETSDRLASLHRRSFDWLLIAVGGHIGAVVIYDLFGRRSLVKPMLTGRKPASDVPEGEAITASRLGIALALIALCAAGLAVAITLAPEATLALSF